MLRKPLAAVCAALIVVSVIAYFASGATAGFLTAAAAALIGLAAAWQPVPSADSTPASVSERPASLQPDPRLVQEEPFAVSREELRSGSNRRQMRASAEKIEAALTYHMSLEAREWAEDAVRFLQAGNFAEGAKALDAAGQLTQNGNPLVQHYLYEARRALAGDA